MAMTITGCDEYRKIVTVPYMETEPTTQSVDLPERPLTPHTARQMGSASNPIFNTQNTGHENSHVFQYKIMQDTSSFIKVTMLTKFCPRFGRSVNLNAKLPQMKQFLNRCHKYAFNLFALSNLPKVNFAVQHVGTYGNKLLVRSGKEE